MSSYKIISWNVNGIRAQIKKDFFQQFADLGADIFCIQETKAQDDQVLEALQDLHPHHIYCNSAERKGYSGTCIISRDEPISVQPDIGVPAHDQEGRVLLAEYPEFYLVNVYIPNSGNGLKRLDYRAEFDEEFNAYLFELSQTKGLIVTGDFNVAPTEIDLARPKENYNKTAGFTQTEIDGIEALYGMGLFDAYRKIHGDRIQYTFWNARLRARESNIGWRIDFFLLNQALEKNLISCDILDDIYGSDHCPLSLQLQF